MSAVMKESRLVRDAAIRRAAEGADYDQAGWTATAYYTARAFLKLHFGTFTTEQIREYAYKRGLPVPRDERAWGSILKTLAEERRIRKCGYVQATGKACHMHPVTNWKVVQ